MKEMIGMCGIDCEQCPAYIASMTNNNELRKKTAEEWKIAHNFAFTPEMINCHGCHATDGVQVGYCSMCEIRKCAVSKEAENCGVCTEYPCKIISDFHAMVPGIEKNLRR